MKVRHATTKQALREIVAAGYLDPSRAKGAIKGVWLHTPGKTAWAILHTAKRHGAEIDDVVVIDLVVPASFLTRRGKGLWTSRRPIAITDQKISEAKEFYRSSIDDRSPDQKLMDAIWGEKK